MEPKSPKSQPHNNKQHVPDSHPSVHTVADEFIVQVLTQELETLVLSCEHERLGFHRDRAFQVSNISVTDDDDDGDRTEHAVGVESDERCHVAEEVVDVVLSDSLRKNCEAVDEVIESGDVEEVVEVDLDECRVLSRDVKDCEKLLYDQVNGTDEKVEKKAKQVEINTGEKVEKKDKQVEIDECRVLEAREIGEKMKEVDEHDDEDVDVDVKLNEEVEIVDGEGGDGIGGFEVNGEEGENVGGDNDVLKSYHYPLRPDAEDCSYYMRTGMCKYGSNCKFNHPLKRKHQPVKETHKPKEENMEMHGQIECKYYMSPVGCKYGQSCKFSHSRRKPVVTPVTPVLEHNFLGLPIRPGEKECPFYMRNGSCKYGQYCKFNHPDPSAVGDAPTTYGNDGPLPLQPPPGPPQPNIPNLPTWSGPRTPDPTAAFVPVMYPPTQNMPPPNPDWNGYQAPAPVPVPAHVYPSSDRGLPIPPAFFMNNPQSDTNMYTHPTHPQQPMMVSEYPERPGQPDCSYYMKTGDCKYRASCKFHHPKSRITRNAPSVLSDKGLPLRPDQNICTHYSRYGICKYGPACKYDHPVNYNMNSIPAGDGYDGSARSGPLIQQSV